MSEVQNAPGPWKSDGQGSYIFDAKGDIIVQIRGWGHLQYLGEEVALKTQDEIQRRIVAAVNACRGIATEDLETDLNAPHSVTVGKERWLTMLSETTMVGSQRDAALRERDEARAMVKELAARLRDCGDLEDWLEEMGLGDEDEGEILSTTCGTCFHIWPGEPKTCEQCGADLS